MKTLTYRRVGRKRPLERHTASLVERDIIPSELKDDLDWMWEVRTEEHLDAHRELNHCRHDRLDFNRAQAAWNQFMGLLSGL